MCLFQYTIALPCINSQALIRIEAEIVESLVGAVFGQNKISRHLPQEVTNPLQLALIAWERTARKALMSSELVYSQWRAVMAIPRTGQLWTKCFFSFSKFLLIISACSLMSICSHPAVDDTQPCTVLVI